MGETQNVESNGRSSAVSNGGDGGVTVIKSPPAPLFKSILAFALWVGVIHLFFACIFTGLLLLPLPKAILLFAFMALLVVLPVEADSYLGLKVRRFLFENVCGYFPITLHIEDYRALVPNRTYIFGYEPHSVLPVAVLALYHLSNIVPKAKVLASSAVFRTPFLRHVWTWMGLSSVTKENFLSLLSAGYGCVVVPGGARETLHMVPEREIIFLKTRKGFIRSAIQTGTPLIPVFAFGQSEVYNWWRPTGKLFLKICKIMKFTPMFFWGVFGTPLPHRVPLHVVVGKPIEVMKNPQPTTEEVDELHGRFVGAMEQLFERHKARVGYPDRQLKIM